MFSRVPKAAWSDVRYYLLFVPPVLGLAYAVAPGGQTTTVRVVALGVFGAWLLILAGWRLARGLWRAGD